MTNSESREVGRPEFSVVKEDFESGPVICDRCDEAFSLWFNGGELDGHTCKCGRRWQQRARGYNTVSGRHN